MGFLSWRRKPKKKAAPTQQEIEAARPRLVAGSVTDENGKVIGYVRQVAEAWVPLIPGESDEDCIKRLDEEMKRVKSISR